MRQKERNRRWQEICETSSKYDRSVLEQKLQRDVDLDRRFKAFCLGAIAVGAVWVLTTCQPYKENDDIQTTSTIDMGTYAPFQIIGAENIKNGLQYCIVDITAATLLPIVVLDVYIKEPEIPSDRSFVNAETANGVEKIYLDEVGVEPDKEGTFSDTFLVATDQYPKTTS